MPTLHDAILNGATGMVLCPFHDDRRPSARVFPDGSFHCYVCGKHANNRVELIYMMDYADEPYDRGMSLARAAMRKMGIAPQTVAGAPKARPATRPETIAVMTWLANAATENLAADSEWCRRFAEVRGLRDPVALGLGLTNPGTGWAVAKRAMNEFGPDLGEDVLQEARIIIDNKYKLGRRLLIPEWRDGKAIFYQARSLNQHDVPKYLNPSLPKPIFGLHSLRQETAFVVVSEGPFDVLPLIEAGGAAVALMGSFSAELNAVELAGRTIIVGLDNDEAGRYAGQVLTDGLIEEGMSAIFLPPPDPYGDYSEWAAARGAREVLASCALEVPCP